MNRRRSFHQNCVFSFVQSVLPTMMFSIFFTTVLQVAAYDRQVFDIKFEIQSTGETKGICLFWKQHQELKLFWANLVHAMKKASISDSLSISRMNASSRTKMNVFRSLVLRCKEEVFKIYFLTIFLKLELDLFLQKYQNLIVLLQG